MIVLARFCLGLGFSLFVALNVYGQGVHTLQGKVMTPSGIAPPAPVRVTLTYNGRPMFETFTDLGGHFSFSGIAKGTYELTAEGDDVTFETTTVSAEVSAFGSAPQLFTQNIQLRALRTKPTPRASVVNSFSQTIPKAAQQLFERASKVSASGKNDDAVKLLTDAIQIFPDYFDAHIMLGKLFLNANRLEEATAELDRARQINPKDDRAYQSFGLIMMRQKNFALAVAVFAEAERLNPTNPVNALLKTTALINQAYAIDPASSEKAAADRAYIIERAEISLQQLSQLSEKKLELDHFSMAMFYEMKGDRARAAKELEEHLRANPGAQNADEIRAAILRLRAPVHHP